MSDELPRPAASPQPPKGPGEITQPGIASTTYVKQKIDDKLSEVELHLSNVAREAARAGFEESQAKQGTPVISRKLTPIFLSGFILCGSITSVVIGDPDVPGWVLKLAAIGSLFFGGLLGIGPGWRR